MLGFKGNGVFPFRIVKSCGSDTSLGAGGRFLDNLHLILHECKTGNGQDMREQNRSKVFTICTTIRGTYFTQQFFFLSVINKPKGINEVECCNNCSQHSWQSCVLLRYIFSLQTEVQPSLWNAVNSDGISGAGLHIAFFGAPTITLNCDKRTGEQLGTAVLKRVRFVKCAPFIYFFSPIPLYFPHKTEDTHVTSVGGELRLPRGKQELMLAPVSRHIRTH